MKKDMSLAKLKEKIETDFLILLTEEYGFRVWFWFPNIEENLLIEWWKNLESVEPYFMTPEPLEGCLVQAKDELYETFYKLNKKNRYITMHLHCNDDSFLKLSNGKNIYHKGYQEDD